MAGTDVDYEGEIARSHADGRRLSPEATATWRAAVARLLLRDRPIIDVGAGTGRYAALLAELTPAPVIAVEPASAMRRSTTDGAVWSAGTAEITPSLRALADRMAHRSISTLRLIADAEFDAGLTALRARADELDSDQPVFATNVMLEFVAS